MYKIILTLVVAISLLAVGGCDTATDLNGGLVDGEGSAAVTGDVGSSFSGDAFWTMEEDNGEQVFGLFLIRGALEAFNEDDFEMVATYTDDRPPVGTHEFEEDVHEGAYVSTSSTGSVVVFGTSGSMEVTTSTTDRLVGSMTFTGEVFGNDGSTGTATVEASFDASYIDPDDLPEMEFQFRPLTR